MRRIFVNNGDSIVLNADSNEKGLEVVSLDSNIGINYSYVIPEGEMIMLLNYYRNCKSGLEKSDYISKGKIVNTNSLELRYL